MSTSLWTSIARYILVELSVDIAFGREGTAQVEGGGSFEFAAGRCPSTADMSAGFPDELSVAATVWEDLEGGVGDVRDIGIIPTLNEITGGIVEAEAIPVIAAKDRR
jgi:hypothetical protein